MKKEKKLQKAVLMSLLLTNIWCSTTDAASGMDGNNGSDRLETGVIDVSGIAESYYADNGTAGTSATDDSGHGGNGGNGGSINANYTAGGTVNSLIYISAVAGQGSSGGNGGSAAFSNAYGGAGGDGGHAEISLTLDQTDFTVRQIVLDAHGGSGSHGGDSSAYGSDPNVDNNNYGGNGGNGGHASNKGLILTSNAASVSIGYLNIAATGGSAGNKGSTYEIGSRAAAEGGAATVYGITSVEGGKTSVVAEEIAIVADGGIGGTGSTQNLFADNSPAPEVDSGGQGGMAKAYGLYLENGELELTSKNLHLGTNGGTGGNGGAGGEVGNNTSFAGGAGAEGGAAYTSALQIHNSKAVLEIEAIGSSAWGGVGGEGGMGSNGAGGAAAGTGGNGGTGGQAESIGLSVVGGNATLTTDYIDVYAVGGAGGTGGAPGIDSFGTLGGNGGDGGSAYAKGIYARGSDVTVATDELWTEAYGGHGGFSSYGGNYGKLGAEAKAYGIYAEQQATINLHAKTSGGTINVIVVAEDAVTKEKHALYADSATVLFHDNASINTSDGATPVNEVLTTLKNATLGFGGTAANRTVTGGTFSLTGSNTFRFTTDLANNASDKFTFGKLGDNSSIADQYITVGYDKSFDGSNMDSISGETIVLTVADLNGQDLNNFKGKTSTLDAPLTRFTATPTVEVSGNDVKIIQIDFGSETAGGGGSNASETAMTASDAQMALGSLWRVEGSSLMERMGELRSDKDAAQGGVWARYYRGELSADSAYGRSFGQDYTGFQGGIDKVQDYKGGKLYTGIAINHIDSKAGYNAGSGDLSSTGIGLYASWLGSKGHYFDLVARGSRLANDFKLVDISGNSAKGDYDTWAYGISAEYGYRQNLKAGWFVEPQAELSLGRIGSAAYTISNGVHVKQDSISNAVTRLGVLGGKEFTVGGQPGNAYLKASVLHDFGGNGSARGYYGSDSLALQTGDLTGTWYEVGIGANFGLGKNSNLYFDALKTFNGDLRTDWQFNAGLRFTF